MEWKGQEWRGEERNGEERNGIQRYVIPENKKKMKKYKVEITGRTPILQNKPAEYGFDEQWVEKQANSDWEKEALQKLYINPDGIVYEPSIHIERTLIEAGKKVRIKGSGKATYSKLFGSMINVEPYEIKHENQEYEIHKSLVVIPSTKGRVMRYRPMIKDWKLSFYVLAEEELDKAAIKECLEIAGKYSGLGDWRPEKKGKFGKFQVTHFEEMKE